MYNAPGRFGNVGAHYRNVDLSARIEGASAHKLVSIQYEELMRSLTITRGAMRQGDPTRARENQNRALMILSALEGTLDFEKGGQIANALSSIYRETRRLVTLGAAEHDPEKIEQAKKLISDIASAWDAIG